MKGVSIVVCCYNSSTRLQKTIEHIAKQETSNLSSWELIIVNNNSTDNTVEIATIEWKKYKLAIPMHIVNQPIPGLSAAREQGVKFSKYDYILFCDDDNWLSPEYIERGYNILEANKDVAILGGKGEAVSDVELPVWFEEFKLYYATGQQAMLSGYLNHPSTAIYGAGMFMRKIAYLELLSKGFKSFLTDRKGKSLSSGGDVELNYGMRLIGYRLYYDELLTFKHYIPQERLGIDYLLNLTSSISYSSSQLMPYYRMLQNRRLNNYSWVSDFFQKVKYILIASLIFLLKYRSKDIRVKIYLLQTWNLLKSIWKNKESYASKVKMVKQLKTARP
jgi:glycosyltransferase involved in cell wall biosynthesis